MSFYGMTKEKLIAMCMKLQSENKKLKNELYRLSDSYTEMESSYAVANNRLDGYQIYNVYDFAYRLQLDGLLTPQLESFIEDYLKYYNRVKG